jgi:hypothetical protein
MSVTLQIKDWDIKAVRYMTPKVTDKGGKSINIISNQTNKTLSISTPLMMSWGIADFVDEKGESDGKFSISLNFPGIDYPTAGTTAFLDKLKKFEESFIDDAVKNSELWWGEPMSREVVKHMYFPILKYSKSKETKKIDYSKPPSIRAKVPNYGGKWNVEIYDIKMNMIFPDPTNSELSPIEFVPKLSQVACMISIANVWIGGKGFGITLKLSQCIVKPKLTISSTVGKCQIQLSDEDIEAVEELAEEVADINESNAPELQLNTQVEDSDDEQEQVKEEPTVVVKVEEPTVVVKEEEPTVVVKEEAPVLDEPVVVKKKILKKKVV